MCEFNLKKCSNRELQKLVLFSRAGYMVVRFDKERKVEKQMKANDFIGNVPTKVSEYFHMYIIVCNKCIVLKEIAFQQIMITLFNVRRSFLIKFP